MFLAFLRNALGLAPLFIYGQSGETLTEKGGHLNMGTPGVMCIGMAGGMVGIALFNTIVGGAGANLQWYALIGLLLCMLSFAVLFGVLAGLLFSFFTVSLRCNQNVMGLTLTTFGIGFYALIFTLLKNNAGLEITQYTLYCTQLKYLFIPENQCGNWFETIFLSYGFLWYLSFIIAIIIAVVLKNTKVGLNLRAVGEGAASADAAGINVSRYRYISTLIGCAIASIGGLYYMIEMKVGLLEFNELDIFGWLAVALVIFTVWRTDLGIAGAIIFAMLYKLPAFYPLDNAAWNVLFKYLPYFVTIVILIVFSIFNKNKLGAPKDLGIPYFREDR